MFKGAYTAIVTPFNNGNVDHDALRHLVNDQIELGIDGLVACGSTGEAFFLTPQEQYEILKTVMDETKQRVPVIAGTSALKTADTKHLVQQAESLNPDGLMIVTPPYVKPSQEALYDYFHEIHQQSCTPILLYDNPSRAAMGMSNDVVIRLAKLPRITSLKDATSILSRPTDLQAHLPADFTLLSGEDATALAYLAQGGHGVVSVTSNVAPNLVASQCKAWSDRDLDRLADLRVTLNPLHKAMFCEPSPAPAKYALSLLGICKPDVREPLQRVSKKAEEQIQKAMIYAGLETHLTQTEGTPSASRILGVQNGKA